MAWEKAFTIVYEQRAETVGGIFFNNALRELLYGLTIYRCCQG